MDNRLLLVKAVTLLYRESQLIHKTDNSRDLVRTVIDTITTTEIGMGVNSEREIIAALRSTVLEMCQNGVDTDYDKATLLQRLKLNTGEDEKFFDVIASGIDPEINENQIKRTIISIQRSLNNHFREQKIDELLNKASYQFKHHRDKIKDVTSFIADLMGQLEPLSMTSALKDPAVMDDLDIGDDSAMERVFNEVKTGNDNVGLMITGWQAFNEMTQGGLRRGECVLLGGLQHKYKTGFTLSLFKQIALYNVPHMLDGTKKPLLLRISFEDDLRNNLQFLYQNLMFNETGVIVSVKDKTVKEMSAYVKSKLQVNGYHIKMMRVDPSGWSYKHICNKVLELEALGYEIHLLMVDYLFMLPTIGCTTSGPMGSDKRDMLRRMRNFCGAKKICFFTPQQLNTEVKRSLGINVPEEKFLGDIAEKGKWDSCATIDQETDLELYVHKFKFNNDTWLNVVRGKHRLPTIIDDAAKSYYQKFPKVMPIPDDLDGEKNSVRKITAAATNADESLFTF